MVFLCWARPSPEQQKSCINKSGTFNYDTKYKGATAKSMSCIKDDKELSKDGYLVNHARVLVGSGLETYEKGKAALQNWRHFGLNWAFVDPKTPIQSGVKFCVCLKEFLPWVMMPLQVVYVKENTRAKTKKAVASFGFGSGTLQGHLLAGEERFSIELDENDQVWLKGKSLLSLVLRIAWNAYLYLIWKERHDRVYGKLGRHEDVLRNIVETVQYRLQNLQHVAADDVNRELCINWCLGDSIFD